MHINGDRWNYFSCTKKVRLALITSKWLSVIFILINHEKGIGMMPLISVFCCIVWCSFYMFIWSRFRYTSSLHFSKFKNFNIPLFKILWLCIWNEKVFLTHSKQTRTISPGTVFGILNGTYFTGGKLRGGGTGYAPASVIFFNYHKQLFWNNCPLSALSE